MMYHTADYGCGAPHGNRNVKLNYSSTLESSVLILTCENEMSNINTTDEEILSVTCHSNGSWIPNPADFTCSFTTVAPGMWQDLIAKRDVFDKFSKIGFSSHSSPK